MKNFLQYSFDKESGFGRIELNNPPYNSFRGPLFADKEDLSAFFHNSELKAIILSGQGRHFSSGADLEGLKKISQDTHKARELMNQGKELLQLIASAPVPTLAMIRGSCFGAGLELALSCTFRFASQNAMFGFPEVEYGLMPGFGGTVVGCRTLFRADLIDLCLSGRMIRAEEAEAIGLIDKVQPNRELVEQARHFLHLLVGNRSPDLVRTIISSIHYGEQHSLEASLKKETELFCHLLVKSEQVNPVEGENG